MEKVKYTSPAILEDVEVEMEESILSSSAAITDDTEVVSTGQQVSNTDLTSHSWE